jgi:hypothetical protein
MGIITKYGSLWPRNKKNISALHGRGVYIIYDGAMPVYVGKGHLRTRIGQADGKPSDLWDHFSWYCIPDEEHMHDVESLMLRLLPWYLRGLNKQKGNFLGPSHSETAPSLEPHSINRRMQIRAAKSLLR